MYRHVSLMETILHHIWVWMTVINQIVESHRALVCSALDKIKKIFKRYTFKTWGRTHPKNSIKGLVFFYRGKLTKSLGKTLSNSLLKFPSLNHHWLKHRSKSYRVPHSGFCFAGLYPEANQPPRDPFNLLSQSTLLLRQCRRPILFGYFVRLNIIMC